MQQQLKLRRLTGKRGHPDKGGDLEKVIIMIQIVLFLKLTEGYEILSNPEEKDLYERFDMEGGKNGGGIADMPDILVNSIGSRKETGPKKMKAQIEVEVTL